MQQRRTLKQRFCCELQNNFFVIFKIQHEMFFFSFKIQWYCYPAAISYNIENSLIGLILRRIRLDNICLSTYSYNILESLLELTLVHMSTYLCILTCTRTYRCLNVLYLSFYVSACT